MNKNYYFSELTSKIRETLKVRKFESNERIYTDIVLWEESWRDLLLTTDSGKQIYEKFVDYIVDSKKNILDARPFFRVRQRDFLNNINPHIKRKKPTKLHGLRINSTFIAWATPLYDGVHKKELQEISDKILELRSDFITRNFPFILNRIKPLYHTNDIDISDLIAIASGAALVALDKFAPTVSEDGSIIYTSVLLSSIIARINAAVNQTVDSQQLHLYPSDKKIFVEICKLKKNNTPDFDIASQLKITEFEVSRFLNGINIDHIETTYESAMKNEASLEAPDEFVEKEEQKYKLKQAADKLSIIERKILILKGMLPYER